MADLTAVLERLGREIQSRLSTETPDLVPVVRAVLSVVPDQVDRSADARAFLNMLGFLTRRDAPVGPVWAWATAVAGPFESDAVVQSLLASLGDQLREQNPASDPPVRLADLEDRFRRAMELDPAAATVFGRAGLFYLHHDNDEKAKQLLQKSLSLDPTSYFIAMQLADVFDHTGEPERGLQVLQACSAAGSNQPDLLWKTALAAVALNRPQVALNHLRAFDAVKPNQRWSSYYQSVAALGLNLPDEAAAAIDREATLIRMPTALHVQAIRASLALIRHDAAGVREQLRAATDSPLSLVNYLAPAGVVGCYARLDGASRLLPANDTARAKFEARLLASGLTPPTFWTAARAEVAPTGGLRHYSVEFRQPVDGRWTDAGHALPDRAGWKSYRVRYGVLAGSTDEAKKIAGGWQLRSIVTDPGELLTAVADGDQIFTDKPGVTERSLFEKLG